MSEKRTDTERRADAVRSVVQQTAGQLVLTHLTKIVVGLGALLVLVWNLRGDLEQRERRLDRLDRVVQQLTTQQTAIEQRVDRLRERLRDMRRNAAGTVTK